MQILTPTKKGIMGTKNLNGELGHGDYRPRKEPTMIKIFVENGEKRYLSARYTLNYYFGRIFRILPLYYFILLTVKFLSAGKFFASKTVLFQLKNRITVVLINSIFSDSETFTGHDFVKFLGIETPT